MLLKDTGIAGERKGESQLENIIGMSHIIFMGEHQGTCRREGWRIIGGEYGCNVKPCDIYGSTLTRAGN